MIEHYELYFIQRNVLREAGGGASLRSVTLQAGNAYLAFTTRNLAQAYIDATGASGVAPVSATAPGLAVAADFDATLLLLLDSGELVTRYAAAPAAFDEGAHLHRGRIEDNRPRWYPLAMPAPAMRGEPGGVPASMVRGAAGASSSSAVPGESGAAPRAQASNAQSAGARSTPSSAPSAPPAWGLLPERAPGEALSLARLMRHFFIDFNPLYFISAGFMLYGVFLVARHIEDLGGLSIEAQQFSLFGVIQLYEVLVIAAAAFLGRVAGARRPAVLLALLECALLFDCTFRLESAAVQGTPGYLFMLLWLLLTAAKLGGLAYALRLPFTRRQLGELMAVAAGLVGCIIWLSTPGVDKVLAVQGTAWFGAAVLLLLELRRPALLSAFAQDEAARHVAALCLRAAYRILIGFYFYHLWAYIAMSSERAVLDAAIPAHISAALLLGFITHPRQRESWLFGLLMLTCAVFSPTLVAPALQLVGALWIYRVVRGGHGNLAVGAACAFYLAALMAAWSSGVEARYHLPMPFDWPNPLLAAALLFIAFYLRNSIAWGVLAALLAWTVYSRLAWGQLVPQSEIARGMVFLAAGFAALIGGVVVNWLFRARPGAPAQA